MSTFSASILFSLKETADFHSLYMLAGTPDTSLNTMVQPVEKVMNYELKEMWLHCYLKIPKALKIAQSVKVSLQL